jgi:hypothetical protein
MTSCLTRCSLRSGQTLSSICLPPSLLSLLFSIFLPSLFPPTLLSLPSLPTSLPPAPPSFAPFPVSPLPRLACHSLFPETRHFCAGKTRSMTSSLASVQFSGAFLLSLASLAVYQTRSCGTCHLSRCSLRQCLTSIFLLTASSILDQGPQRRASIHRVHNNVDGTGFFEVSNQALRKRAASTVSSASLTTYADRRAVQDLPQSVPTSHHAYMNGGKVCPLCWFLLWKIHTKAILENLISS